MRVVCAIVQYHQFTMGRDLMAKVMTKNHNVINIVVGRTNKHNAYITMHGLANEARMKGYTIIGSCPDKLMMMCKEHNAKNLTAQDDFCYIIAVL